MLLDNAKVRLIACKTEKKIQNLINDLEVLIYQLNDLEEYEKQAVRNCPTGTGS